MKIAVNAASAKMGGAVSYITNLLRHLSTVEGDFQFLVFVPPETADKLDGLAPNIRLLPTKIGHAGMLRRIWWEQVTLRRFLEKEKVSVLFSTANFGMLCCSVRQLLLVRNALYFSEIYRETFLPRHSWRFRLAFALRRRLIVQSARSADVVVVPTRAMLDELRSFVDVRRALVNPYGVPVPELTVEAKRDPSQRRNGAGEHACRLLYVSLYSEHKNLNTLLRALSLLNRNGGPRFELKTTADPGWAGAAWTATHTEDLALANRRGIREYVDFEGPLSREEIEKLYQASDIFVFPSLTESFGFPMAEAMAHGLPIAAADTPVNREMCGEAAVYFAPLSAEDLAGQVLRLATDRSLCGRLREKGWQRASSRFSWSTHARRVLEAASFPSPAEVPDCRALPQPQ